MLECIAEGLHAPVGLAFDVQGALFIAEWTADRVIRIAPDGSRATVQAHLDAPAGLVLVAPDSPHEPASLLVASSNSGRVLRLADGHQHSILEGLRYPVGLARHAAGGVLLAVRDTGELLHLHDGDVEVLARGLARPAGAVMLPDGCIVISEYDGRVSCRLPDGQLRPLTTALRRPAAGIVALDARSVAVADYQGGAVYRVTLDGEVSTLAEGLVNPVGLTMGPDGRLYVATWGGSSPNSKTDESSGQGTILALTLPPWP
ncbi:NHL repeat-containing protein [Megalodesulfovibrio paquesii]